MQSAFRGDNLYISDISSMARKYIGDPTGLIGQPIEAIIPEPFKEQHKYFVKDFVHEGKTNLLVCGFRTLIVQLVSGYIVQVDVILRIDTFSMKEFKLLVLVVLPEECHATMIADDLGYLKQYSQEAGQNFRLNESLQQSYKNSRKFNSVRDLISS